ncbi:MAG: DsbA family protein [Desulfobulbaceae bacterium]|nr:DsbA family protein [Desulfobulbaceae bacterium]
MKYLTRVVFVVVFALIAAQVRADGDGKGVDAQQILAGTEFEVTYGDPEAPVVITEYSSLSCPYCKKFHAEIIDRITKTHIDTGKAYYVFRFFPVNMPALRASMLVYCVRENEQKKRFVKALFEKQSDWANAASEEIFLKKTISIAQSIDIDTSLFRACAEDENLEDKMLTFQVRSGSEVKIRTTPTVFIDGERYVDDVELKSFTSALDNALNKKALKK